MLMLNVNSKSTTLKKMEILKAAFIDLFGHVFAVEQVDNKSLTY